MSRPFYSQFTCSRLEYYKSSLDWSVVSSVLVHSYDVEDTVKSMLVQHTWVWQTLY